MLPDLIITVTVLDKQLTVVPVQLVDFARVNQTLKKKLSSGEAGF